MSARLIWGGAIHLISLLGVFVLLVSEHGNGYLIATPIIHIIPILGMTIGVSKATCFLGNKDARFPWFFIDLLQLTLLMKRDLL